MDGMNNIIIDDKKYHYTWNEFDEDINHLYQQIKHWFTDDKKPKLIIGIARGGLIPAVALSHLLEIPFKSTTWQDRDGGTKENIFIPDDSLVVDDINDTGLTFKGVCTGFNTRFSTVSLWQRQSSLFDVDFRARLCDNEWIVFPWEKD